MIYVFVFTPCIYGSEVNSGAGSTLGGVRATANFLEIVLQCVVINFQRKTQRGAAE